MKKRSGISVNRAYRIQRYLINRIEDIYETAGALYLTHEDITDMVNGVLFSNKVDKAPGYVLSYAHGYLEAKRNELYDHKLIWVMWLDGYLRTRKEINTIKMAEHNWSADKKPGYMSPWARIDTDKSRHVWIDGNSNPLLDKSFDRKFRK